MYCPVPEIAISYGRAERYDDARASTRRRPAIPEPLPFALRFIPDKRSRHATASELALERVAVGKRGAESFQLRWRACL